MKNVFGRAIRIGLFVVFALVVNGSSVFGQVVDDGADWLITEQDTGGGSLDGSFPWTPGGSIFANTQGATALGLVRAYEFTGDITFLNSALENGDFIVGGYGGISNSQWGNGDPRFATHDPLFLEELSNASGNSTYSNYVQTNFWDKLSTSSYSENNYDAASYGSAVVSNRFAQGNIELAAWDISKTAIAAHVAGETSARNDFIGSIVDGLEMTTASDSSFDLHGLSGAIWASVVSGQDLDPTAGRWSSADSTNDLITELLGWQSINGGWVFNTNADINNAAHSDTQVTAFAVLALHAADADAYALEINAGLNYLESVQQGSGQFLIRPGASPSSAGGVEVHGEALEAYATAIPEPASAIVLVLAGLGLIRRRKRVA